MIPYKTEDGTEYPLIGTISWDEIKVWRSFHPIQAEANVRTKSFRLGTNHWYGVKAAADELGVGSFSGGITKEMIAGMLVELRVYQALDYEEIFGLKENEEMKIEVVNPRINVRVIRSSYMLPEQEG